ncbi:hypothetical protein E2C01_067650 [Portunus trituberculatus]|uniref:Uncharacterized protein n=1 Tax=Portunus trituberculatus TaxID=210409 RepID=A0A5B7HVM1_PORTR|nr:hypothetical protein [Portunus trituberculatus]
MARIFSDGRAIADDALRAIFDGGGGSREGGAAGPAWAASESRRAPPAAHTLLSSLLWSLPAFHIAAVTQQCLCCASADLSRLQNVALRAKDSTWQPRLSGAKPVPSASSTFPSDGWWSGGEQPANSWVLSWPGPPPAPSCLPPAHTTPDMSPTPHSASTNITAAHSSLTTSSSTTTTSSTLPPR